MRRLNFTGNSEHVSGFNSGSHAGPGRGLVVLNVALLAALGAVTLAPRAGAQMGNADSSRVPGDYSLVGGESLGTTANTIYVLDSANRELVAMSWNDSTNSLQGIGYRDLVHDSNSDPDR